MNIALCGLGRAGKQFVEETIKSNKYKLCKVLCRDSSQTAGKQVKELTDMNVPDNLVVERISDFDNRDNINVIVDFSSNPTTFSLLEICCKYGISLVICPTNFTDIELQYIKETALTNNIGVVFAPTLTVGVNMLIDFVTKFSSLFTDFDFAIVEKHGKNKSKPTKTAEIIKDSIYRKSADILSVRLDGYVGVHEVIATNDTECITIKHESFSRKAFVNGALVAADFIKEKKGYYNIIEVYKRLINSII